MKRIAAVLLALTGCATTVPGQSLARYEDPTLAGCEFGAAGDAAVWRCAAGRLLDARVGVQSADAAGLIDVLGAAHPSLARPEFSRSDANTLEGDPIRLTMLGYADGLALVASEAGGRGRMVTCVVTGKPSEIAADTPQWCKPRMGAVWKAL